MVARPTLTSSFTAVAITLAAFFGCQHQALAAGKVRLEFAVKASCLPCIREVDRLLRLADGVEKAVVFRSDRTRAIVIYDSGKTEQASLLKPIKEKYIVEEIKSRPVKTAADLKLPDRDKLFNALQPPRADHPPASSEPPRARMP